jgi:hypothetical protein
MSFVNGVWPLSGAAFLMISLGLLFVMENYCFPPLKLILITWIRCCLSSFYSIASLFAANLQLYYV